MPTVLMEPAMALSFELILDRSFRQIQVQGDLVGRVSFRNQAQDFVFTRR